MEARYNFIENGIIAEMITSKVWVKTNLKLSSC